jgi:glycosyltransferase involved in cell wall biosynthesis
MSLTVFILAGNEAVHIERAIASARGIASRIMVIDSGATDGTTALAVAAGADVLHNPWTSHAAQINWTLDNAGIATAWTFRLDADEIILPELAERLRDLAALPTSVAGFTVNRRLHFMGRWLRHGGLYPVRTLRLWRTGLGRCDGRWMDERIIVAGTIGHIDADIADINLRNIGWWTAKHNDYATREAIAALLDAEAKTAPHGLKRRLYAALPSGLRGITWFLWRYIVLMGFRDGSPGLIFLVLQSIWYRALADVKQREIAGLMASRKQSLSHVALAEYGIRIDAGGPNSKD